MLTILDNYDSTYGEIHPIRLDIEICLTEAGGLKYIDHLSAREDLQSID